MVKYPMKSQMIKECEDEIALNTKGCYCSSHHVKQLCRQKVRYLKWKISRIMKDKSFDNPPASLEVDKFEINI